MGARKLCARVPSAFPAIAAFERKTEREGRAPGRRVFEDERSARAFGPARGDRQSQA